MNPRAIWPLLGLLCACGDIDPAPPVDDEGKIIPLPKPLDTWLDLRLVQDDGEGFALNPVLVVQADTYMDDDTLISYAGGQLTSGGLGGGGALHHVFTQRRLYWTPSRPLIDGLEYRATFALPDVRSVTGSPPLPPATLTRLAIADGTRPAQALPPEILETPGWDEIAPILTARCGGCHGQAAWPLLVPMERDALVNTRDARTDRPLVRPFDPADSYLLHKLLPDYPDRRGTQQPPPWSDDPTPLTPAQLLKIERWIAGGAPGDP
jgi:hypothetical protein